MQNNFNSSTDSKEHSVEVKRENENFSVPQQQHPITSSVDDTIDNTPIYRRTTRKNNFINQPFKKGGKNGRQHNHKFSKSERIRE